MRVPGRRLYQLLNARPVLDRLLNVNGTGVTWYCGERCHARCRSSSVRSVDNWQDANGRRGNACRFALHRSCFHTSHSRHVMEDRSTKSLTIWSNLKEVRASPLPALTLGLAGLVPFVAVPAYMMSQGLFCPQMASSQVAYGASILSFLGGVRWGFTLPEENPVPPDWVNLGYSVTPALVAWTGLMLPTPYSLLTVMGGLTLAGYCDMAMYGYPPWFKGLRFTLSFIAILSLWTTFMCSFLMKKKGSAIDGAQKEHDQ